MVPDFITPSELATYLGTEAPSNAGTLIARASELVYMAIKHRYNPDRVGHLEAAKMATCAQVQDWIEREASAISSDNVTSYSLGSLSVSYANDDIYRNKMCLMSVRYLHSQCLLYKGLVG